MSAKTTHAARLGRWTGLVVLCAWLLPEAGCSAGQQPGKHRRNEARPAPDRLDGGTRPRPRQESPKPPARTANKKKTGHKVVFTVLFDSTAVRPGLGTGWGFACLVQTPGGTLLFDTGADGRILLKNLKALGHDPARIRRVAISHPHGDHTGGLGALLRASPGATVYLPAGVSASLVRSVRAARGRPVKVGGKTVLDGGYTLTGPLGGAIPEQALAVSTPRGVVMVTGCAHPQIERMLPLVRQMTGAARIHGLIGGLHLGSAGTRRIKRVIAAIKTADVRLLGAGHCTGRRAMAVLARTFPTRFVPIAVGKVITVSKR